MPENEAVKSNKNPFYYVGPNSTVDLVILNEYNEILLIRRKDEEGITERGKWACPGGFLNGKKNFDNTCIPTETIEQAAVRETNEEANMDIPMDKILFVNIFEGGGRDPRDNPVSWSKSHAFVCQVNKADYFFHNPEMAEKEKGLKAGDDADGVQWIKLSELNTYAVAFDHREIIQQAQKKLKKNLAF